MDVLELQTLASELADDAAVAVGALELAERRYAEGTPASFDSCGHHLSRCYNVIEHMGLRVAKAFENSLDDDKGWHTELIRRLSIRIPGVRPALFSEEIRQRASICRPPPDVRRRSAIETSGGSGHAFTLTIYLVQAHRERFNLWIRES